MTFEWKETTLGEVLTLQRGMDLPLQDRRAGTHPIVASTGIVGYHDTAPVKGAGVVIGRSGSIGGGQYIVQDFWPLNTTLWVKDFKGNDPRYCYYLLKSIDFSSMNAGSGVPTLNRNHLHPLKVVKPSLSLQKSIAAILGNLDDRITLLRETNTTLEAIAQALFKSWFVHFDPVRSKSEGKLPEGMDEATAALFPDAFEETELGMVPKGWVVDSFGNWIDVLETGRRPKGGVSGIDSGIPSIGAESVTRIGEFDYSKLKFVPSDFFAKMKTGKLQSKDVLLYKDGGKPGVFLPRVSMFGDGFPFDVCGINEHVFRLRIKKPLGQTFLYFWLWSDSVMHELKHRGGKAAIPGINQSDVKELRIAVPEGKIATEFEEITSPLVSKILANAKSINSLSNLRDTLLPRLISGQLRIASARAELEKVTA